MNLRRKLMQLLAAGPFLAQSTVTAQSNSDAASDEPSARLRWGHININVSDLDASINFYEKLGFWRLHTFYSLHWFNSGDKI